MATSTPNPTLAVQSRREFAAQMRAKGYKRVVRWVPDTANPAFQAEYRRQLSLLSAHQRAHPNELIEPDEDDLKGWV